MTVTVPERKRGLGVAWRAGAPVHFSENTLAYLNAMEEANNFNSDEHVRVGNSSLCHLGEGA